MTLYAFEGRVPEVAATAYVAPSAQVIGRVVIGEECWIGHGAILRGDYGTILVGDQTAVEDGVIVHARPDDTTRLGRRVTLGHGCMVHNATIRDGATIGMRATVSDFSEVGAGAVIGEMALVRQHQKIPPRTVAVGVPAEVIGDVSEKHRDMTVWAKDVYIDLARRYPDGLTEIAGAYAFRPIGVIRTPFAEPADAPRQGALAPDAKGTIELDPRYAEGLDGLDQKKHIALLWVFHRTEGYDLRVTPHGRDRERGLFSTRAPCRPNPIGLTVVTLERVEMEENRLHVCGVDMVDGTPLLDIKPSNPELDAPGGRG